MNLSESILHYKQYLKRKNYSVHTVKNYLHRLQRFIAWLAVPVESAQPNDVKSYIDTLLERRLSAQTVNGHLVAIRRFYGYLIDEEQRALENPAVSGLALRLPRPLPRHLRDGDIPVFFAAVKKPRDVAMFMLMLRCGLRVEELANLTLDAIDYRRNQIVVRAGKGAKDRVFTSVMMRQMPWQITCEKEFRRRSKRSFWWRKGPTKGNQSLYVGYRRELSTVQG